MQAQKSEMNDNAVNAIIFCLGDKVLREVARGTIVVSIWTKLESLYMTKSLSHRQILKQQLYFFRMVETKSITDQLTEFNKIIDDLVNIDVNLENDDKSLHLACSVRYLNPLKISRILCSMVKKALLSWRKFKRP
jgi:hypothetical protein